MLRFVMGRIKNPDDFREIITILRQTQSYLEHSKNYPEFYSRSDTTHAINDIERQIAIIQKGLLPYQSSLTVMFAPTGPIDEVSVSNGWNSEFQNLGARMNQAVSVPGLFPEIVIRMIWFHTTLELMQLAAALGFEQPRYDGENYWDWVIGTVNGIELDICNSHTLPNAAQDTVLFQTETEEFEPELKMLMIERLKNHVLDFIYCGRSTEKEGKIVVETH